MITLSITKCIPDAISYSYFKDSSHTVKTNKLSTAEKIKEVFLSSFNYLIKNFRNLTTTISCDFLSKKNLVNLSMIILFSSAMFYTFGISEIIFQVILSIIFIKIADHVLSKLKETNSIPNLKESYPLELKTMIFKILIGVVAFLIFGRLEPFLSDKISDILKKYFNISITIEQNVGTLIKADGLKGIIFSLYGAIGAPILEEYIFRGCLHNYFEINKIEEIHPKEITNKSFLTRFSEIFSKPKKSSVVIKAHDPSLLNKDKLKTILKVSLIFALIHLSPVMGWTNIPIMLLITIMGLIMSILKESTGDLWASTSLHMLNNSLAVLQTRKII